VRKQLHSSPLSVCAAVRLERLKSNKLASIEDGSAIVELVACITDGD
jgi:hypothetical protein